MSRVSDVEVESNGPVRRVRAEDHHLLESDSETRCAPWTRGGPGGASAGLRWRDWTETRWFIDTRPSKSAAARLLALAADTGRLAWPTRHERLAARSRPPDSWASCMFGGEPCRACRELRVVGD